jgi:rhomboid protease GluP
MTSGNVIAYYGQSNALVFRGLYWQLLTSMFVHINIVHIFANMLFLFIFGLRAEDLFSTTEYYSIYLASGLTGNLLSLLAGPNFLSAGASGAIFGVFGADIIFLWKGAGQSIVVPLTYAFLFFILSVSINTNLFAHLGGLVAGLLMGYFLAGKRRPVGKRGMWPVRS